MKASYTIIIVSFFCLAESLDDTRLSLTLRKLDKEYKEDWDMSKTAVIVCDMWDKHHCKKAEEHVAEMAPHINRVIKEMRNRGAVIIHCPSDTMDYYADYPQQKRALAAPLCSTKVLKKKSIRSKMNKRLKLPIESSSCGHDYLCSDDCKAFYRAWSRQIDSIEIDKEDAIAEGLEAYYYMKEQDIENVLLMGVHTNMCVLQRPFGIIALQSLGLPVVLMRDLTDTMYDQKRWPYVDHFVGNDLVTWYVELFWCPTMTSDQVIGGKPFCFHEDRLPPRNFSDYGDIFQEKYPEKIILMKGKNE